MCQPGARSDSQGRRRDRSFVCGLKNNDPVPYPYFGRVVLGSHGMCCKKQVNHNCRASPPTWTTAGFKPLEAIPPVLTWLAALNKKGGGPSESTRLTGGVE